MLFYHVFFFFIIHLYSLIPAVITQLFNPLAELVIPTGIPATVAKGEIKAQ